jgi:hypothetical protein
MNAHSRRCDAPRYGSDDIPGGPRQGECLFDDIISRCVDEGGVLIDLSRWSVQRAEIEALTTANEYMQELPESVQQMVGTVFAMLNGEGSQMVY